MENGAKEREGQGRRRKGTEYVRSESTRLDASELDAPLGLYFLGNGFGETLDGPFRGAVDAEDYVWEQELVAGARELLRGRGAGG